MKVPTALSRDKGLTAGEIAGERVRSTDGQHNAAKALQTGDVEGPYSGPYRAGGVWAVLDGRGTLPGFLQIPGHNHFSTMGELGAHPTWFGDRIIDFITTVTASVP